MVALDYLVGPLAPVSKRVALIEPVGLDDVRLAGARVAQRVVQGAQRLGYMVAIHDVGNRKLLAVRQVAKAPVACRGVRRNDAPSEGQSDQSTVGRAASADSAQTCFLFSRQVVQPAYAIRAGLARPRRFALMRRIVVALLLTVTPMLANASGSVEQVLRQRIEQLRAGREVRVDGARIAARNLIASFYERRGFEPAWMQPSRQHALLRAVEASRADGLEPRDYHLRAVREIIAQGELDAGAAAGRELLFTDSLIRLAYTLYFGKLEPRELYPEWNFARTLDGIDPVRALNEIVRARSLRHALEAYAPRLAAYRDLKRALARYREIAAHGGWPRLPAGPTLRPGMRDRRVAVLRARLTATGDFALTRTVDPAHYGPRLEAAVQRYQHRNGLADDGLVGRRTRAAMNVSVGTRIDEIRVNLERLRWVAHNLKGAYLVVDIAGFRARLVIDGRVLWSSRVIVGKPYRSTPVFRATMRYIVLNPTWNVPPTILKEDVIPQLVKNSKFLRRHHMKVLDFAGHPVNPAKIDWARYLGRPPPYQIVQAPGGDNPLGRLKFIFPNAHDVYLHDTPAKGLFESPARAFSSGCIRVAKPLGLAVLLLDDPKRWSEAALEAAIATGETRYVAVKREVPVMLLYWTARADGDGMVEFRRDLYERDAAVLRGLEARFRFKLPRHGRGTTH